ncbi:MAG TPA: thioesterase family protein [Actinomycetota bacterium]|nr:thioesterase family protein [Actinomycetota bacterium]
MAASITSTRRVQWADTDASGWYHNTVVLRWIEETENELMDRLGILQDIISRVPRVHIEVDYRTILRFWDEVEVHVEVTGVKASSVDFHFEVRHHGDLAADGRYTAVLVGDDGKPQPWSDEHRDALRSG